MSVVAWFEGGPLDGTTRSLPEPTPFLIARPMPLNFEADEPYTLDLIKGRYDPVGRVADAFVYQWRGWSDDQTRRAAAPPWPPSFYNLDEPGPDAMRWTPDQADAEIAAWDAILHADLPVRYDTEAQ